VQAQFRNPVHTMTPKLDGRMTDYFEWLSAGYARPGSGESMHRSQRCLDRIYFGFDFENFYLRIDLAQLRRGTFPAGMSVQVRFAFPVECSFLFAPGENSRWQCIEVQPAACNAVPVFAADKVLEIGIPLSTLGIRSASEVGLCVSVREGGREVERFPVNGSLTLSVDPWGLNEREWFV